MLDALNVASKCSPTEINFDLLKIIASVHVGLTFWVDLTLTDSREHSYTL